MLDAVLKQMGIRQLVVTGCTTSVCVESTIRDAMFHDYNCVLLVDCTVEPLGFGFPRSNHEGTLFMVERLFGSILKSLRLLPDLRALHPFA